MVVGVAAAAATGEGRRAANTWSNLALMASVASFHSGVVAVVGAAPAVPVALEGAGTGGIIGIGVGGGGGAVGAGAVGEAATITVGGIVVRLLVGTGAGGAATGIGGGVGIGAGPRTGAGAAACWIGELHMQLPPTSVKMESRTPATAPKKAVTFRPIVGGSRHHAGTGRDWIQAASRVSI